MTKKSTKERLKEILNAIEIEDDGGCGDPECCGSPNFNISHQSKEKALSKIIKLVREIVPKKASLINANREDYGRINGYNICRQEILERLGE